MTGTEKATKKILIIEDDPYIVRAYTLKLAKEGIAAEAVNDGETAVDFLKKNKPPDLIILDLMLPRQSGFDVLKEIKQSDLWKDIPVIILSNLGSEEDKEKGKKLGASDYITKADAGIEEVIAKIKKYLK